MGNILEKRKIKVEKIEDENFKHLMQNSVHEIDKILFWSQELSILSDRQDVVFILIYKVLSKTWGFYCF